MIRSATALAAALFMFGCVSTDYAGRSYPPTEKVDVYFSPDEVEREYTVMGKARSSADESVEFKSIEKSMVKKAMANGADGLIFQDIRIETVGESRTTTGTASMGGYYYRGGQRYYRNPTGMQSWSADSYTTTIQDKVVIADFIKYTDAPPPPPVDTETNKQP